MASESEFTVQNTSQTVNTAVGAISEASKTTSVETEATEDARKQLESLDQSVQNISSDADDEEIVAVEVEAKEVSVGAQIGGVAKIGGLAQAVSNASVATSQQAGSSVNASGSGNSTEVSASESEEDEEQDQNVEDQDTVEPVEQEVSVSEEVVEEPAQTVVGSANPNPVENIVEIPTVAATVAIVNTDTVQIRTNNVPQANNGQVSVGKDDAVSGENDSVTLLVSGPSFVVPELHLSSTVLHGKIMQEGNFSSADHWGLSVGSNDDGGSVTIDVSSNVLNLQDGSFEGGIDLVTYLFEQNLDGTLGSQVAYNDDERNLSNGTLTDNSISGLDPKISLNSLPEGDYVLVVGRYHFSESEATSIENFPNNSAGHGSYHVTLIGDVRVVSVPTGPGAEDASVHLQDFTAESAITVEFEVSMPSFPSHGEEDIGYDYTVHAAGELIDSGDILFSEAHTEAFISMEVDPEILLASSIELTIQGDNVTLIPVPANVNDFQGNMLTFSNDDYNTIQELSVYLESDDFGLADNSNPNEFDSTNGEFLAII